jgi:hypothetical protein
MIAKIPSTAFLSPGTGARAITVFVTSKACFAPLYTDLRTSLREAVSLAVMFSVLLGVLARGGWTGSEPSAGDRAGRVDGFVRFGAEGRDCGGSAVFSALLGVLAGGGWTGSEFSSSSAGGWFGMEGRVWGGSFDDLDAAAARSSGDFLLLEKTPFTFAFTFSAMVMATVGR